MLNFTKMQGLGNDILIINHLHHALDISDLPITQLAMRHTGIGFDQLLILEPSARAEVFCRIFNSDGSEAEQCGNGLRCVARFLHENAILTQNNFSIETRAGIFPIHIHDYANIEVQLGSAKILNPSLTVPLENGEILSLTHLAMGNPHAVVRVTNLSILDINALSLLITKFVGFTSGINIGYMQVQSSNEINLRTHERGVGETLACGSNACAAVVTGVIHGWLTENVKVNLAGGTLKIAYEDKILRMTGPAVHVFDGVCRPVLVTGSGAF